MENKGLSLLIVYCIILVAGVVIYYFRMKEVAAEKAKKV